MTTKILPSPNPPSPSPGTVLFQTDRLLIRRYLPSDAPALAAAGNDPLVAYNLSDRFPHPYTLAAAESFLASISAPASASTSASGTTENPTSENTTNPTTYGESNPPPPSDPATAPSDKHYPLDNAIFLLPNTPPNPSLSPLFIGGIGVKPKRDVLYRTWEVGYWIASAHWRQGYTSEALAGFARYLFATWPTLRRLEGVAYSRNVGSQGVLQKAGFVKEGVRKEAVEKKGVVLDMVMFRLLRSEFEEAEASR